MGVCLSRLSFVVGVAMGFQSETASWAVGSLTHSAHECADLRACNQFHTGLQGGLGSVVDGSAAPVHAQELHCRVLEERRELPQPLVYPRRDLSDGGCGEVTILVSGKAAIPWLQQYGCRCSKGPQFHVQLGEQGVGTKASSSMIKTTPQRWKVPSSTALVMVYWSVSRRTLLQMMMIPC